MNHQENLKAYLDGELSASEVASLESAIRSDAALAAELEELKSITSAVRSIPEPVPYGLEQTLWKLEKLNAKPKRSLQWGRWLAVGFVGAGAIVLALNLNSTGMKGMDEAGADMAKSVASLSARERADNSPMTGGQLIPKSVSPRVESDEKARPKEQSRTADTAVEIIKDKEAAKSNWAGEQQEKVPKPLQEQFAAKSTATPKVETQVAAKAKQESSPTESGIATFSNNRGPGAPPSVAKMGVAAMDSADPGKSVDLRTESLDSTKAQLVRLVHSLGGTINLGQPKGSPLTATIQIPEDRSAEFNAAMRSLTIRSRDESAKQMRGGMGGGGGGLGTGQGASSLAAPGRPQPSADMVAGTVMKRTKDSKKKRTITVRLIPVKE